MDTEVLFNVEEADDGGYVATAPSHGIVTQADSIDELHAQVRDAVACHFDVQDKPSSSDCISFETRFSLREAAARCVG